MNFDIVDKEKYFLQKGKWKMQMSQLALKWLSLFLEGKSRIMEFGSGISTVWMGKSYPEMEICSVEGNKDWYERVRKWLKQEKVKNVNLKFIKQDANYRLPKVAVNDDYVYPFKGDWDLIINDGAIRETIGDTTMERADGLLRVGGIYLRHDYEKAIKKYWLQTGWDSLGYDKFCAENDGYELITVSGNGRWGYLCELGGIWRIN